MSFFIQQEPTDCLSSARDCAKTDIYRCNIAYSQRVPNIVGEE